MFNKTVATAAPIDIQLGGETFRMSPLTDADLGELDNYVRSRVIRAARESLGDGVSEADRQAVLRAAVAESMNVSFATHWRRELNTLDGMARLFWQTLRRCHPGLTVERVRKLLHENPRDVEAMAAQLEALNANPTTPRDRRRAAATRAKGRRRPTRGKPIAS